MFLMLKTCTKGFSLVRMTVLAAALLLVPFSALAGGLEHHISEHAENSAINHLVDTATESTSDRHSAPAEHPLHCHQKSPTPQATVLVLEPFSPDQPPPVIEKAPLSTRTVSLLNRFSAKTPIAALHRFILFGNFRS